MKQTFLLLLLPLLAGCTRDIPGCIHARINEFKKQQACAQGASVKKYVFQGKDAYVFDPGTCGADLASEVTDSDCNTLGYLGGISGNTKINGEEFSRARFKETIWQR